MEEKINWFPGHMNKAIRNAEEKLKLIDLIIEIVDARAPFSSSNPIVNKLASNKLRLVILAKKDLADPKITKQWIQYYQEKNINVLALDLFSKNVTDEVVNKIFEVLNDKFNKQKAKGIVNYQAKVIVLGVPNVGKSTFINTVIRKNSAKTGNRPGVTKGQQWLKLNDNIDFLDTPGILWNKIENQQSAYTLAVLGSIKEKVLPIEEVTFNGFKYIYNHYFDLINEYYNLGKKQRIVNDNKKIYELFNIICKNNNFKVTESVYDIEKAVELVFKDIRDGKIGAISFETPDCFDEEKNLNKSGQVMKTSKENNQLYLFDQQFYQSKNIKYLAGTDETGRGSLAGPIVTAAVILPHDYHNPLINDSKKISASLRQRLYFEIIEKAIAYSVCEIDYQTVEKINPKNASQLGMQQAITNLQIKPDFIITDFEKININIEFEAIEKGDSKSQTIAAASIIAKYTRDKIMENLHHTYPLYDFAQNKGYGTLKHLVALNLHGPCEIHRKTFSPVKLAFLKFNEDK